MCLLIERVVHSANQQIDQLMAYVYFLALKQKWICRPSADIKYAAVCIDIRIYHLLTVSFNWKFSFRLQHDVQADWPWGIKLNKRLGDICATPWMFLSLMNDLSPYHFELNMATPVTAVLETFTWTLVWRDQQCSLGRPHNNLFSVVLW